MGSASLYAYDLRHNFGRAPTVEKFNLAVIFLQFKHWQHWNIGYRSIQRLQILGGSADPPQDILTTDLLCQVNRCDRLLFNRDTRHTSTQQSAAAAAAALEAKHHL